MDCCMTNKKVAFIGSVGIPNRYGGFESFLENVAPVIAATKIKVFVTCYTGAYNDCTFDYKGVERVFINVKANGALSPIHDFLAFLKVVRHVQNVVVLGVSAGPFFVLMRCIAWFYNVKIIVNIDGVEWRRDKYNYITKKILFIFDRISQICSDSIIYDNVSLKSYILNSALKKSVCIPYSGDHIIKRYDPTLEIEPMTALTVCRVEPENNLEMLIEGFLKTKYKKYTIVGNFENSKYGKSLRKKYNSDRVQLLDPIYDPVMLNQLRQSAMAYLHGHSVGGTNPSLVEMLFYDAKIYCFDCDYNLNTAGKGAKYFSDSIQLSKLLNDESSIDEITDRDLLQSKYMAKSIAQMYIDVMQ